jgi:hypothetical protein
MVLLPMLQLLRPTFLLLRRRLASVSKEDRRVNREHRDRGRVRQRQLHVASEV